MIIAQALAPLGKKLLLIGLSEENLKRLKAGQPIYTSEKHHLPDLELFIFYGETEQKMMDVIKGFISPDAEVHIDPRIK